MNENKLNQIENECPICLDPTTDILECGHKIHVKCVEKHFIPECPQCRKPLNIKVYGKKPEDEDLSLDLALRMQQEELVADILTDYEEILTSEIIRSIFRLNNRRRSLYSRFNF